MSTQPESIRSTIHRISTKAPHAKCLQKETPCSLPPHARNAICARKVCANAILFCSPLNIRGLWEVDVVDRLHNILRRKDATAEPTPIESANGVCATLNPVEFDVDLAFVALHADAEMDDVAVFLFAFAADVGFEVFLPVGLGFSVLKLASGSTGGIGRRLTRQD